MVGAKGQFRIKKAASFLHLELRCLVENGVTRRDQAKENTLNDPGAVDVFFSEAVF